MLCHSIAREHMSRGTSIRDNSNSGNMVPAPRMSQTPLVISLAHASVLRYSARHALDGQHKTGARP